VSEGWAVLVALAAVVLPLLLAWWLLGRGLHRGEPRQEPRGKMPRQEDR
jgi:hypothetical protein